MKHRVWNCDPLSCFGYIQIQFIQMNVIWKRANLPFAKNDSENRKRSTFSYAQNHEFNNFLANKCWQEPQTAEMHIFPVTQDRRHRHLPTLKCIPLSAIKIVSYSEASFTSINNHNQAIIFSFMRER